ncbi:hypothetical protein [Actinomadura sp. 21ATH]|uniref:hypothetical protein n=1 Tax=Actinomadura sp. 21ATH TaxID=1735444 RepID=UPI0035C1D2FD
MTPTKLSGALLLISALVLTGCGSSDGKSAPKPSASTPTSKPPPTYTAAQVERGLLAPAEIGSGVEQIRTVADVLKNGGVPICSLSAGKLDGSPQVTSRQFSNKADAKDEVKYTQVIARYDTPSNATAAFEALKTKAESCPPKQHVAPRKVRENFTVYAHDDTWKLNEDRILDWRRIRGTEQQKYSASTTKYNIFHVFYDYAVQGNLIVATMYYERTEPKKSGDPIAKRATEVLTRQLQRFA